MRLSGLAATVSAALPADSNAPCPHLPHHPGRDIAPQRAYLRRQRVEIMEDGIVTAVACGGIQWSQDEQLACKAGIKAAPLRLPQSADGVTLEMDEGDAALDARILHHQLALRYAGRDDDRETALRLFQPSQRLTAVVVRGLVRDSGDEIIAVLPGRKQSTLARRQLTVARHAVTEHLTLLGFAQQEEIAESTIPPSVYLDAEETLHVVGMLSHGEPPPRIVGKVTLPVVQLTVLHQYMVIISPVEERRQVARLVGIATRAGSHPPRDGDAAHQRPPRPRAPSLEATHHMTQMAAVGQRLRHVEDEMDMVGHDARTPHPHHGIDSGDPVQLLGEDGLAQGSGDKVGIIAARPFGAQIALHLAEDALAVNHRDGDEIGAGGAVVMGIGAAVVVGALLVISPTGSLHPFRNRSGGRGRMWVCVHWHSGVDIYRYVEK